MSAKKAGRPKTASPIGVTSPLYDEVVTDFLERLAADEDVPDRVVESLRTAFAAGTPGSDDFLAALRRDDDLR